LFAVLSLALAPALAQLCRLLFSRNAPSPCPLTLAQTGDCVGSFCAEQRRGTKSKALAFVLNR